MMRVAAFLLVSLWLAAPAAAESRQEIGQMRLYIQQLEERVRQLTGQNEQLSYELNQLRAQVGQGGVAIPDQTGALAGQQLPGAPPAQGQALAVPPQDLGGYSIAPNDPLIAPDGVQAGGPIDLSVLAGGGAGARRRRFWCAGRSRHAGIPCSPPCFPARRRATSALSGTPRDEYDLAYGYILTGDYGLAEESFRNWLAAFPSDPQAADAQFWLGESHFQQREYRDAANSFLAVYKTGERSSKGPDALTKLGMSLAALGEKGPPARRLPRSAANIPAPLRR